MGWGGGRNWPVACDHFPGNTGDRSGDSRATSLFHGTHTWGETFPQTTGCPARSLHLVPSPGLHGGRGDERGTKKLRLTRSDELWEGHTADHRAPQEGPSEPGRKELRGWCREGRPLSLVWCVQLCSVLIGKATFWLLLETVFFASRRPLALTVDCILVRKSVVHFNSC